MSLANFLTVPGQPVVVNIHKKNGIRPYYTLYIGRALEGSEDFKINSKWANIYPIERYHERSFGLYEKYARKRLMKYMYQLSNQVLGCWCIDTDNCGPPLLCHGQILIKLWLEMHDSPCITRKCKFFKNGLCIHAPLGCFLEDEDEKL